jgi:phosphatidylglycerol:prolipoprotein diacylglycerol transferase
VPALLYLLSIDIGIDPTIADFGPFELTWHGLFTAVGILLGFLFAARFISRVGVTEDDAFSIMLIGTITGIIGARAMFVLENRVQFEGEWLDVLRINEGGITIYGAVIGGVLGAVAYGLIRRLPIMRGLDAAGFGLLLGMAIGRIGDLINGEHISKATDLPWGVVYTHPASPSWQLGATHPATTYEMIGDLLIIGVMLVIYMRFWAQRPGLTFFTGLVLYSAMRFGVSYLRVDSCPTGTDCPEYIVRDWMTFPQVVSVCTFAIGVAGLTWSLLRPPQRAPSETQASAGTQSSRRAAPSKA